MNDLFEQFIREKEYLTNAAPSTLKWYRATWRVVRGSLPHNPAALSPATLKSAVIALRSGGSRSAITVNTYLRVINAFLAWLHAEGYTPTALRAPSLTEERHQLRTYTKQDLNELIKSRPRTVRDHRAYVLILLLADTGIRIKEALNLRRDQIDFDSLLLTVFGKGRKDRTVPFSRRMRGILWKWLEVHDDPLVFATRSGRPLMYRNALRDFQKLAKEAGLSGKRLSFHTFRRSFATNYIKQGGNVFMLQRVLGHTNLEMTKRYVQLQTADLAAVHERFSPLA